MEEYSFGIEDEIKIDHCLYIVKGFIQYENINDGYKWTEYCLLDKGTRETKWLSIDPLYEEYAIYTPEADGSVFNLDQIINQGFREADSGRQKVVGFEGNVDVDMGETADFWEYEDSQEENIIAIEQWSDGRECSRGYYLDKEEITFVSVGKKPSKRKKGILVKVFVALGILGVLGFLLGSMDGYYRKIYSFLDESSSFKFKTAITSDYNSKEKASVYQTALTLDAAVKKIIDGIEGDVEYIQQNNEDDDTSVAIITNNEYCLIYEAEGVWVQVSSRSYIYGSKNKIYRGRGSTYRFYRRYYYSTVYDTDKKKYSNLNNSYTGYKDSKVDNTSSSVYNGYASSVRQSSIASRRSSGGGTGFGK